MMNWLLKISVLMLVLEVIGRHNVLASPAPDAYSDAMVNAQAFVGLDAAINANANANVAADVNANINAGLDIAANVDASLNLSAALVSNLSVKLAADANFQAIFGGQVTASVAQAYASKLAVSLSGILGVQASASLTDSLVSALVSVNVGAGASVYAQAIASVIGNAMLHLGVLSSTNFGAQIQAIAQAILSVDISADLDIGLDLGLDLGAKVDVKISAELLQAFKKKLSSSLCANRYFMSVFSGTVPTTVASSIASAISQSISRAFAIPRSYLISLENNLAFVKSDLPIPAAYADCISNYVVKALTIAKVLSPIIANLQVDIAVKAVASAVKNFLLTSIIPGVGMGVSNNPYNSYFSILSGLETLPYVGVDTSRKLSPIQKAVKSAKFAQKFTSALYYNLVSSNRFGGAFTLGVSTEVYKNLAVSLGKAVAEAFGSTNSQVFTEIYANTFLLQGGMLSYKTHAQNIARATSKALYALGYFLSGNANVQAAVAGNAIILAVDKKYSKPSSDSNYRVDDATNKNSLLGIDANLLGLGLDASVGAGLGIGLDASLGAGLDASLGVGLDASLGVGLDAAVGVGLGAKADLGAKVGLGLGATADLGAKVGVGLGATADLGAKVGVGLGANVGLDLGANVGLGLNANVGLNGESKDNKKLEAIVKILSVVLNKKLNSSVAFATAVNLVGANKIAMLIAQGIASTFSFDSASAFIKSFNGNMKSIRGPADAVAKAAAASFAAIGVLNPNMTISNIQQLSVAFVTKISSLIVTSLEIYDWNHKLLSAYNVDTNGYLPANGYLPRRTLFPLSIGNGLPPVNSYLATAGYLPTNGYLPISALDYGTFGDVNTVGINNAIYDLALNVYDPKNYLMPNLVNRYDLIAGNKFLL